MSSTTTFHQLAKGSLHEQEHWWRLIVDGNGEARVEHEWSHQNPYTSREPDVGAKIYSVEDFLTGEHNEAAKERLLDLLKKMGRR